MKDLRRRDASFVSSVTFFGAALESATLIAVSNAVKSRKKIRRPIAPISIFGDSRTIAGSNPAGTCMALSEPPRTIDRDNSIAGAHLTPQVPLFACPILYIQDVHNRGSLSVTSLNSVDHLIASLCSPTM